MLPFVIVVGIIVGGWVFALVDASITHDRIWAETGRNKIGWVLTLIVLPFSGLLYIALIRPKLRAAKRAEKQEIASVARPPVDLRGGLLKCKACGFTSNPLAATECRNCGASI